jgi:hypothetical protein
MYNRRGRFRAEGLQQVTAGNESIAAGCVDAALECTMLELTANLF